MRHSKAYKKRKRTKLIAAILFSVVAVVAVAFVLAKVIEKSEKTSASTKAAGESSEHATIPVINEDITGTKETNPEEKTEALITEPEKTDPPVTEEPTVNSEEYNNMLSLAGAVIDECVDSSDSEVNRIYAAFWWIKCNMKYTGYSKKTDWVSEASRGFRERNGDCYTYFSMMKAMLTEMGYETIDVKRVDGYDTNHYWSLIKYQDEWYHIDSCPRSEEKDKYWYCFLRTDDELIKWNSKWSKGEAAYGYYDFDKSLYPATGTQPLNLGTLQNHPH